ncbi:MAG: type I-C CRISPR-associated protein Cas8c/Csd1 [Methanofollis sp.]|uniref:type I-C CRISPR-associated protein Cas8c/Csd1 n=1 Tax=Methanofollis sp. TaxID=2052835 RepID=UPI0026317993|nr:type I-C CRISPR-associated protein Cas8c/Csd1 [Methanofollis sp.]MDD4254286.1 type I-C CRISPR-associated protein Cas8c/Csd1 [Methanofollis sp.]
MTWISRLCETYDNCSVGVLKADTEKSLLPIGHTTQYAQIEIVLDADGRFRSARALDKDDAVTIIPCTEDSANRTSGPGPHPLFDKLQYVAGDHAAYVPGKEGGFDEYKKNLQQWCDSPYSHPMIRAVLSYVLKRTMIADLVSEKVLYLSESGGILEKWTGTDEEKPLLFRQTVHPADAFVRFCVEIPSMPDSRVWMNEEVRERFIAYYMHTFQNIGTCCVTGKTDVPVSRKSAGKIRNAGDRAKIISSNDDTGFTFRGRFVSPDQAVTLSYEASQKSVNALKWLIAKQGYRNGDQVIVAWGTRDEPLPPICGDSVDLWSDQMSVPDAIPDTREEFASRLNKAVAGYSAELNDSSNMAVMGLDSTNGLQGRLSLTFYRELTGSEFLKRILRWHTTCTWYPLFRSCRDNEGKDRWIRFRGAPSPADIAVATYGSRLNEKLKKATVERLLPCIVDGKPLPWDLVEASSMQASRPFAMEKWEFNQALGVACALIRKYYNDKMNERTSLEEYREVWSVELNLTETDRSYLFGRLLAYARKIEEYSLYLGGADARQTNAERFMLQFRKHPDKTWDLVYQKLLPYMSRFRTKGPEFFGNRCEAGMNSVMDALQSSGGFTGESLGPTYLLGYQSQLNQFEAEYQMMKAKKAESTKDNGE